MDYRVYRWLNGVDRHHTWLPHTFNVIESVDILLVEIEKTFHSDRACVAVIPNNGPYILVTTPKLVYVNTSNLYLDLLADWLHYADAHGVSREAPFFHAAQAKPFRGDSPSSRPVTWFWGVYRGASRLVDLTTAAHSNSGNVAFGAGEALYVGNVDRFREINFQLISGAKSDWSAALEYPSAVDRAGKPIAWTRLNLLQDSTSGFAQSGQIHFDPPSGWKPVSIGGSLIARWPRIASAWSRVIGWPARCRKARATASVLVRTPKRSMMAST